MIHVALPHSLRIIGSSRYFNFSSYPQVRFVNQCLSLLHFPFFSKISSRQFYKMHQEIVSLPLHKKLKAFITTPPWEFTTSSTTFQTYFSTPSVHSFEIFRDCTRYLNYYIRWKQRSKFEESESVLSYNHTNFQRKNPKINKETPLNSCSVGSLSEWL
mgnify:CR=1 FL=1